MKILTLLPLLPMALGHMELSWPYAIRSKYNPKNNYQNIDYSMTSPLLADGSNFPCKGYQNDRPIDTVVEYTPGGKYNISLSGTATHGGGSCQISLSYDNGATFRVIKSIMGGCPLTSTYDFTVPSYVPQGEALLAWTWQNKLGNREYYMNCAAVKIAGSARRHKRDGFNSFGSLPLIWKANVPDVNTCTTSEGEVPVYPEPGPDPEYADGITTSSKAVVGNCNAATPFGATYKNLGDSVLPPDSAGSGAPQSPSAPSSTSSTTAVASSPITSATSSTTMSMTTTTTSATSSSSSAMTTTRRIVVTTTTPPPIPTTTSVTRSSSAAAASAESFPPAINATAPVESPPPPAPVTQSPPGPPQVTNIVTVSEIFDGTVFTTVTLTVATVTTLISAPLSARSLATQVPIVPTPVNALLNVKQQVESSAALTVTVTVDCPPPTVTVVINASTQPATPSPTSTPESDRPSYASGDLAAYLPCVPGSFICTTETTFYTCDYDISSSTTSWAYAYPRQVAAGTECQPNLTPYSTQTSTYGQQGNTPAGTHRDDRIVRSRPDGDCSSNGEIKCTTAGTTFSVCDQGGWVDMGPVAPGTTCQNGMILSSS